MGRRREERVKVSLPVKVWGMDKGNRPFMQTSHAVDITRMGARLTSLFCVDRVGEVLGVQYGSQKARFKVTWLGAPGTAEAGEVGVQCVEPEKNLWGNTLPRRSALHDDKFEAPDDMMTFASDPMAHGGYSGARGSVATSAAVGPRAERPGKRREHPRYPATGTVEVLPEGATLPVWATLNDISTNGCYAETVSPLPAQTRARIKVQSNRHALHAKGVVRTTHPGVGMGLTFTHLSEQDRETLDELIHESIDAIAANSISVNIGDDVPTSAMGMHDIPSGKVKPIVPQSNRAQTGPMATVAKGNGAAEAVPQAAPHARTARTGIASRINDLRLEMKELHHTLMSDKVDARMMREFRMAVEYAQHTAMLLQRWINDEDAGKDPYHLLQELNGERIKFLGEHAHELAMDIDALDVTHEMQGVEKLSAAVALLHLRLSKMKKK